MSDSVYTYQVDADKIKSIWGSKNYDLMDELIADDDNLGNYEDALYSFDIDFDTYRAYIKDIFDGEIQQREHKDLYGLIYEALCAIYGKIIPGRDFLRYIEDVTEDNHKALIPIPSNANLPEYYSAEVGDFDNAREVFLSKVPEYAQEKYYKLEIGYRFDSAEKNGNAIVFFCC